MVSSTASSRFAWIAALVTVAVLVVVLVAYRYWKAQHVACPGTFSLHLRPCVPSLRETTAETDPLHVLTWVASHLTTDVSTNGGKLVFATPALLDILPNDFSQNQLTPYGFVSFPADHVASIPASVRQVYLQNCASKDRASLSKTFSALPANANASAPSMRPKRFASLTEETMYDVYGTLGANCLARDEGYVVHGVLPLGRVPVHYFSFVMYLADRYNTSYGCNPVDHTLFASILPPFNLFHIPARLRKQDVRFAILIAHTPDAPIHPQAPNPNQLSVNRAIFRPETDRWSILFRIAPKDVHAPAYQAFLRHSDIHAYRRRFAVHDAPFPYRNVFAPMLPPLTFFSPTWFDALRNQVDTALRKSSRHACVDTIQVLPSITCIFAPHDKRTQEGFYPYTNGLLAIQMAGNALGDNPDCWYKFSKASCLATDSDVLIVLAANHAAMDNAIYCNLNVNDVEKSRSVTNCTFVRPENASERQLNGAFYVALIGRDRATLTRLASQLRNEITARLPLDMVPLVVTSSDVPLDHHVSIVERAYVNPSVFWNQMQRPLEDVPEALHATMTRPDGNLLLTPVVWTVRLE
ncbi:hypothetical protein EBZ80_12325 [bacterium]|nr:hypothetical protein [bacterium]